MERDEERETGRQRDREKAAKIGGRKRRRKGRKRKKKGRRKRKRLSFRSFSAGVEAEE